MRNVQSVALRCAEVKAGKGGRGAVVCAVTEVEGGLTSLATSVDEGGKEVVSDGGTGGIAETTEGRSDAAIDTIAVGTWINIYAKNHIIPGDMPASRSWSPYAGSD